MPPELIGEAACATSEADIWSFACCVIFMLTGEAPMPGLTYEQVVYKVMIQKNDERIELSIPVYMSHILLYLLAFTACCCLLLRSTPRGAPLLCLQTFRLLSGES